MSGSTRIKGAALKLDLGTPATDFFADVISCSISHKDKENMTFADVAEGAQAGTLKIKAIQSTATASFWRYVWEHSGETVPFTYAPHGNEVPTAAQPHIVGMVEIGNRPDIGGDAGKKNEYVFEVEWELDGADSLDEGA